MLLLFVINCFLVTLAVGIHYETLVLIARILRQLQIRSRHKIVLGVLGTLIAHTVEVWIFAIAYFYMHKTPGMGALEGRFTESLLDCVYFSFSTYTTVGFGDIHPTGAIRYLSGIESLTGLVLITWSASFLYMEMQRYWNDR